VDLLRNEFGVQTYKRERLRNAWNVSSEPRRRLSEIYEKKNPKMILEAIASLPLEQRTGLMIVLVGAGELEGELRELQQLNG